jgi:hypothetical protein
MSSFGAPPFPRIILPATTMADDTAVALTLPTGYISYILAILNTSNVSLGGAPAGLIWTRPSLPLVSNIAMVNTTSILFTTGALTGTTFTDANFNISVANTGILYLENRIGASRVMSVQLIMAQA